MSTVLQGAEAAAHAAPYHVVLPDGSTRAFDHPVTGSELARAIGRMPSRLLLIGIEAEQTEWCTPPSPAVEAAIDSVVDLVGELVAGRVAPGHPAANVVS